MFCKNCGAQLPEGAAFCPHCATKVTEDAPSAMPRVAGPSASASPAAGRFAAAGIGPVFGDLDIVQLAALVVCAIAGAWATFALGFALLDNIEDVMDFFSSYTGSDASLGTLTFFLLGIAPAACALEMFMSAIRCLEKRTFDSKGVGSCTTSSITLLVLALLSSFFVEPLVSNHGLDGFMELGMTFYINRIWPTFEDTVWLIVIAFVAVVVALAYKRSRSGASA